MSNKNKPLEFLHRIEITKLRVGAEKVVRIQHTMVEEQVA